MVMLGCVWGVEVVDPRGLQSRARSARMEGWLKKEPCRDDSGQERSVWRQPTSPSSQFFAATMTLVMPNCSQTCKVRKLMMPPPCGFVHHAVAEFVELLIVRPIHLYHVAVGSPVILDGVVMQLVLFHGIYISRVAK